MPPWVIVETKPGAEDVAERSLWRSGYRVYVPRYRRLIWPHGRERKPAPAMQPLFGRVVFVQGWQGWPPLPIAGVVGLMTVEPGNPAMLSDEDIGLIMARERNREFDQTPSVSTIDFAIGEEVEIEAFGTRIIGVLEELSPSGKAIVAAMLFGRSVRTEVDADNIQRLRLDRDTRYGT
jgi:hypothetical protein